ncbi:MAG: hypothetical protein SFU53_11390 [Terrimicrobiaceae bacterium]|nr:hypothetical protein [Terrimicrobiaceae bacterium]
MSAKIDLLHLTLCGPGDVEAEIKIAQEVVTEWNTHHGDALGLFVQHRYWKTDAYPDASERGQGVINRQLIDDTNILVGLFWSRFGSPTGLASSGTEEEIRRGISLKKHVAIYFSDQDPLPPDTTTSQLAQLNLFREEMRNSGLTWSFRTRAEFRSLFAGHLAKTIHELRGKSSTKAPTKRARKTISQTISGGVGHVQIGGDVATLNHYASPPIQKFVLPRRDGSISPKQEKQIHDWIEALAEATTKKSRSAAFQEWWSRFKKKFDVAKCEALPEEDFEAVGNWYRQQMAILTRGLKHKAPDQWRTARITGIKAAMREMGRTNEDYYPELAARLRIKPFKSLKDLTRANLERVYSRVQADKK